MANDYSTMMDLGLIHFMAYPVIRDDNPELTLETLKKIAVDDFFQLAEVRPSEHAEVNEGMKAIAANSKLGLGVGAQPLLLLNKLSVNDPDEAGRKAAIEQVKIGIDTSYDFGSPICAFLSGPDVENDADRDHAMDLLVESCVELCEYSKSQAGDGEPVWLSLEQFDAEIDKRCLIGPSPRAAELAERVKDQVENFGLTQDLSHMPLLGELPQDMLTPTVDHLIHVHVGNCLMSDPDAEAYGDKHPGFGYPGSETDVEELARFLETLIYTGYFEKDLPSAKPIVSFEVAPMTGEDSDLLIAGTKRAFLQAWAML
jgi:sugar phosphate isomerase/epimerase